MKNALVVLVSILIAFAIGEGLLRAFTDFPVSARSNKVDDAQLGYRLSPALADVDAAGYRNPEGKSDSFVVAAIGDSHTYGNNVQSAEAWPAQFERLTGAPTYNYGVGSYGLFAYHVLVERTMATDARTILIGLYPANDFLQRFPYCAPPEGDFDYWRTQAAALGLDAPGSAGQCAAAKTESGLERLGDALRDNLAAVSAVEQLIVDPMRDNITRSASSAGTSNRQFFGFPSGIGSIKRSRVRKHARATDLQRPEVRRMFANFEKMALHWKSEAHRNGTEIGVVMIPSRERSVHALLERQGLLDRVDPAFGELVRSQIRLETEIAAVLDRLQVPYGHAVDEVVDELEKAAAAGESIYPAHNDGHPYEAGYRAYARAAERLWRTMNPDAGRKAETDAGGN